MMQSPLVDQLKRFCAWIDDDCLDKDREGFYQLLCPFGVGVLIFLRDPNVGLSEIDKVSAMKPLTKAIKAKFCEVREKNEIPVFMTSQMLRDIQFLFAFKNFSHLSYILATFFKVTVVDAPSAEPPKGMANMSILELESRKPPKKPAKRPRIDSSLLTASQSFQMITSVGPNSSEPAGGTAADDSAQKGKGEPSEDPQLQLDGLSALSSSATTTGDASDLSSLFSGMTSFGTKLEETGSMKEDRENMVSLGTIVESTGSVKGLPSVCFSTLYGCKTALKAVTFSSSGDFLAGGFGNSAVRVWQMSSSHSLYGEKSADTLLGHSGPVFALDFSHDAGLLATAAGDSTVRLWERAGAKFRCAAVLAGHIVGEPLWAVAFSPNGALLASGSHDRTVCVWSTAKALATKGAPPAAAAGAEPKRVLIGHKADVTALCFHPAVDLLASGSVDRTIRVWNLAKGTCWRMLWGHEAEIACVKFSPNGRFLASADAKGVVAVWSLERGTRVKTFVGHKGAVFSLDFSREGSLLVSGGEDSIIRIWNAHDEYLDGPDDGRNGLLHKYLTKKTPVYHVMFTRRNLLLAAGHTQNVE